MKHKLSVFLAAVMAVSLLATAYASSNYQSGDVPVGFADGGHCGTQRHVGHHAHLCALPRQPHHRGGQQGHLPPRITVSNNSSVPVALDVTYTSVDLSKLPRAA